MSKKILLADDSLTIQKVVELTFSDSDYELVCVSNGQKALDLIRDDRPDLVLADVVMPEKNGYEVCESIKSNPSTARIPVVLLSGTFEPFDRERAERIGADSIVSKPFDSLQLIAQVDALLDRPTARETPPSLTPETIEVPLESVEPAPAEQEEPPFDVGFSAEDFTAAVRRPSRGIDPFEEEYGRGDVDSAIEAFERSRPQSSVAEDAIAAPAAGPSPAETSEDVVREPQWLRDEPEKAAEALAFQAEEDTGGFEAAVDTEATVAISIPLPPRGQRADEAPTGEIPLQTVPMEPPPEIVAEAAAEAAPDQEPQEPPVLAEPPIPAEEEAPRVTPEPPASIREEEIRAEPAPASEVPRDIEMLAQTSSIPELTQMLSSVARSAGADLSDDQIDKLAQRVVEKLSDRIVREIAWEVIPDMAEIVIKKRIKELEAGIE